MLKTLSSQDIQNKQFMIDMIFGEFGILEEYILSEKEKNNILVLQLKDEINQETKLTIEIDGYTETKEFILVD